MKKTRLTFVITALFAFGLAACGGPSSGNRTDTTGNGSVNTAAVPEKAANSAAADNMNAHAVVPAAPGIAVTALELGKEYQRDPGAFDQKYKGKTLEVTGNAILAGGSGNKFVIMLAAVEDELTSKSVSIECGTTNSEQANELGKAVSASLEQAKSADGNKKGTKYQVGSTYPVAKIKGVYDYSPPSGDHGETMPIISLKPCELTAVNMPK